MDLAAADVRRLKLFQSFASIPLPHQFIVRHYLVYLVHPVRSAGPRDLSRRVHLHFLQKFGRPTWRFCFSHTKNRKKVRFLLAANKHFCRKRAILSLAMLNCSKLGERANVAGLVAPARHAVTTCRVEMQRRREWRRSKAKADAVPNAMAQWHVRLAPSRPLMLLSDSSDLSDYAAAQTSEIYAILHKFT